MKKIFSDDLDFRLPDALKQDIEMQVLREKMIYATKEELYCKGRYKNFFEKFERLNKNTNIIITIDTQKMDYIM